ncbi:MAG: biotin--[acetyl-CoA-carboxylase] ligase [Lachnospiraceae bacterium]|nr:biotin--[acetyl-CoA-carboxylase] ligase [Lachnospiraceae bacterium]
MKSTKEQVLQILTDAAGSYISGQEIAKQLYVTRASVWKAIRALRLDGHRIEAVTNKGYRLHADPDSLTRERIAIFLDRYVDNKEPAPEELHVLIQDPERLQVFETVASTNTIAAGISGLSMEDTNENRLCAVVIADRQTAGRGRRGRDFYSPKGSGIYMSLLVHPKENAQLSTGFTCMMAVAASRAIAKILDLQIGIKWVNDLFCQGKKVAGILTEGSVSVEDNSVSGVIIGIGINVYAPEDGFPKDIETVAGSLLPAGMAETDLRNRLCAAVITEFLRIFHADDPSAFLEEYRSRSFLTGQYVRINDFSGRAYKYALVEGIDDAFHLCVRYDNGEKEALSSGEVSVVRY